MWSTFVVQDEEPRSTTTSGRGTEALAGMLGVRSGGGKRRTRASSLTEHQEGKIKLAFIVATVGITLTVLGVGTEFWVELSSSKTFHNNQTCLAAHYGLWKSCMKKLSVAYVDPKRESCGPIDLPGESNCTYFKIYTTGENIALFHKMPAKIVCFYLCDFEEEQYEDLAVSSAMLAVFSLFLMVMGAVCIIMALSKGAVFFLKPASVCFVLSGLLVFLSLIIFHQSVLSLLASDHSIPLHHELSWSAVCMGCAGTLLIIAGVLFLLLALPYSFWGKCQPNRNSSSS